MKLNTDQNDGYVERITFKLHKYMYKYNPTPCSNRSGTVESSSRRVELPLLLILLVPGALSS